MHTTRKTKAMLNELSGRWRGYAAEARKARQRDRLILRLGELSYWEHMGEPCLDPSVDELVAQITELMPSDRPPQDTLPARSPHGRSHRPQHRAS